MYYRGYKGEYKRYSAIQVPLARDEDHIYSDEQFQEFDEFDKSLIVKNIHARMVLSHCSRLCSTKTFEPESVDMVIDAEDIEQFLSDPIHGEERTLRARECLNEASELKPGRQDFFEIYRDELMMCHEKNQEKQRRHQMSGFLEGLKESDPWYHINSQSYKKVFSGLEEVNRLCSMEPGEDRDKDLKTAYENLYKACDTYLKEKNPDNRKTSLGKKRGEMIQAIREAVSPKPAREAESSEPARNAQEVIHTNIADLVRNSSPAVNKSGIDSGVQRRERSAVRSVSQEQPMPAEQSVPQEQPMPSK